MRPSVLVPVAVLVLIADPFPAVFELSSLLPANGGTGATGFVLNGVSGFSGASVSSAGDVNGDGVDDLIIGAPTDNPNGVFDAGQSYVVFGGMDVGAGGSIELSSLDGTRGFVINGTEPCQESGHAVSSAGDVNGDGIDDLVISDWNDHCDEAFGFTGRGYVIFGGTDVGAGGSIELSSLDGANGFVVSGGCGQVFSVSPAGDVNGDGIDDVIMGAPPGCVYCPPCSGVGESYVIFGGPDVGGDGQIRSSSLDGTNGFVLHGIDAWDNTGESVNSAGDVNGDGIDDLIIGATGGAPNGNSFAGESYVVFGGADVGAGGMIELSSLDGVNGFVINGIDVADRSGGSVAGVGDVNDDGVDDLIIGARGGDPNGNSGAGESYVVFGGAGLGSGGVIELSSLDGVHGFVLNGIDADDSSGRVASAGDVNGDGIPDLIIGATGGDPNGNSGAGESYVVFGGAGLGAGGVIELSSLDGVHGFVLSGIDVDDFSGRSVASAGDVNGDGTADLLIGATGADPNGQTSAGESYVVYGRPMNRPPECPSTVRIDLWPPDHRYEELDLHEIVEVSDPDGDPISFSIEGIAQDESVQGRGAGNTPCDAEVSGDSTFRVRRERRGGGDGRVYTVDYMAHDDKGGACRGVLEVGVAADPFGGPAVNGGALVDSLACDPGRDRFPR